MRVSAAEWMPCLQATASDLRVAKSFVGRDGRLLVTNGVDVVRAKPVGNVTYQTTRNGTRVDVTPEPVDDTVSLNRNIKTNCAI